MYADWGCFLVRDNGLVVYCPEEGGIIDGKDLLVR